MVRSFFKRAHLHKQNRGCQLLFIFIAHANFNLDIISYANFYLHVVSFVHCYLTTFAIHM